MTNKYHARKVTVLGHEFDSKKEADRFLMIGYLYCPNCGAKMEVNGHAKVE